MSDSKNVKPSKGGTKSDRGGSIVGVPLGDTSVGWKPAPNKPEPPLPKNLKNDYIALLCFCFKSKL